MEYRSQEAGRFPVHWIGRRRESLPLTVDADATSYFCQRDRRRAVYSFSPKDRAGLQSVETGKRGCVFFARAHNRMMEASARIDYCMEALQAEAAVAAKGRTVQAPVHSVKSHSSHQGPRSKITTTAVATAHGASPEKGSKDGLIAPVNTATTTTSTGKKMMASSGCDSMETPKEYLLWQQKSAGPHKRRATKKTTATSRVCDIRSHPMRSAVTQNPGIGASSTATPPSVFSPCPSEAASPLLEESSCCFSTDEYDSENSNNIPWDSARSSSSTTCSSKCKSNSRSDSATIQRNDIYTSSSEEDEQTKEHRKCNTESNTLHAGVTPSSLAAALAGVAAPNTNSTPQQEEVSTARSTPSASDSCLLYQAAAKQHGFVEAQNCWQQSPSYIDQRHILTTDSPTDAETDLKSLIKGVPETSLLHACRDNRCCWNGPAPLEGGRTAATRDYYVGDEVCCVSETDASLSVGTIFSPHHQQQRGQFETNTQISEGQQSITEQQPREEEDEDDEEEDNVVDDKQQEQQGFSRVSMAHQADVAFHNGRTLNDDVEWGHNPSFVAVEEQERLRAIEEPLKNTEKHAVTIDIQEDAAASAEQEHEEDNDEEEEEEEEERENQSSPPLLLFPFLRKAKVLKIAINEVLLLQQHIDDLLMLPPSSPPMTVPAALCKNCNGGSSALERTLLFESTRDSTGASDTEGLTMANKDDDEDSSMALCYACELALHVNTAQQLLTRTHIALQHLLQQQEEDEARWHEEQQYQQNASVTFVSQKTQQQNTAASAAELRIRRNVLRQQQQQLQVALEQQQQVEDDLKARWESEVLADMQKLCPDRPQEELQERLSQQLLTSPEEPQGNAAAAAWLLVESSAAQSRAVGDEEFSPPTKTTGNDDLQTAEVVAAKCRQLQKLQASLLEVRSMMEQMQQLQMARDGNIGCVEEAANVTKQNVNDAVHDLQLARKYQRRAFRHSLYLLGVLAALFLVFFPTSPLVPLVFLFHGEKPPPPSSP